MNARVISLNTSTKKGVIKTPVNEVVAIVDFGIEGDAHGGPGKRQVSLLGKESINKMTDKGIKGLCSGKFAENITTEGIILFELPIGTMLKIGNTLHEVSQIGKECHAGCAIMQEVGQCIMPKEGIFTKVIKGGVIKVNDIIEVLPN